MKKARQMTPYRGICRAVFVFHLVNASIIRVIYADI